MRTTTRRLAVAALLAATGVGLLLGGTGSLASWQETATSPQQVIETGSLDLGALSSGSVAWQLSQRIPGQTSSTTVAFTDTALVPGDVLTGTVSLPVELTGQTLLATLTASPKVTVPANPKPADTALSKAITVTIVSIDGIGGFTHTFSGQEGRRTVPVVVEVAYPWGTGGQYDDAVGGTVSITIDYTLSQDPPK